MKVKIIVWAISLLIVLIFILSNAGTMDLRFIKTFKVSAIVVILVSLIIGFISGLLVEGKKKAPRKKKVNNSEE